MNPILSSEILVVIEIDAIPEIRFLSLKSSVSRFLRIPCTRILAFRHPTKQLFNQSDWKEADKARRTTKP